MGMDPQTPVRALVLRQGEVEPTAQVERLALSHLPEGDVLVRVAYSSLNYKDALAITGAGRVVRSYPMVPGIDLAGTVVESQTSAFAPGRKVILTGWGIGESHWGGMAEFARVRSEWLVPLPIGLTLRQAMALGTAGLTAMLSMMALEHEGLRRGGVSESESPEVLVTGASGGVGSIAVMLLAAAGHRVVAASGSHDSVPYLHRLGAESVLERARLEEPSRPLEAQRWGAAIDVVGGAVLARVLAETRYGGTVAACGLAGGSGLETTVMPFILRAVRLVGIDSVSAPRAVRTTAWSRMARQIDPDLLESSTRVIDLEEVGAQARQMVAGRGRGRTVIALGAGE